MVQSPKKGVASCGAAPAFVPSGITPSPWRQGIGSLVAHGTPAEIKGGFGSGSVVEVVLEQPVADLTAYEARLAHLRRLADLA